MKIVFCTSLGPKWPEDSKYYDALQKGGAIHWPGSYYYTKDKPNGHLQKILTRKVKQ